MDEGVNLVGIGHLLGTGVGRYHHGSLSAAKLQTVEHLPATVQTVQETGAVAVATAEGLQCIHGEGTDGVVLAVAGVGGGTLLAMLDDDDLGILSMPVGGRLQVITAGLDERFHQIEFLTGTHNDVGFLCYHGVVDGNFILVLPGIAAVVHVKDDLRAIALCQHHSLQCSFSGRGGSQGSAGNQQHLGVFDVFFVDVIGMKLQVCDAVAVHQNAAFVPGQDLGEGQADLLAVLTAADAAAINAFLLEKVGDEIGLQVFVGWEESYQGADFLVYGLDKEWMKQHPELREISVEEQYATISEIVNAFIPETWSLNRYMNKKNTETKVGDSYVKVFDTGTITSTCKNGMFTLRDLGNEIVKIYGGEAGAMAIAVLLWKEYVALAQKWYAYPPKGEAEVYAEKIKKIDPNYEMPKKAGCISFADKRN